MVSLKDPHMEEYRMTFLKNSKIRFALAVLVAATAASVVLVAGGCQAQNPSGSAGTSSQSSNKSRSMSVSDYKDRLDESLASLVSDGTITSDQESKIIDAMAQEFSSRANRNSGSRPEFNGSRPQYNGSRPSFSGSRPSGSFGGNSALKTLVTNGTITQDQEQKVLQAIMPNRGGGYGGGSNGSESNG